MADLKLRNEGVKKIYKMNGLKMKGGRSRNGHKKKMTILKLDVQGLKEAKERKGAGKTAE